MTILAQTAVVLSWAFVAMLVAGLRVMPYQRDDDLWVVVTVVAYFVFAHSFLAWQVL